MEEVTLNGNEVVVKHITESSEPQHTAKLDKKTTGYTFEVASRSRDYETACTQAFEMAQIMRENIATLKADDEAEARARQDAG